MMTMRQERYSLQLKQSYHYFRLAMMLLLPVAFAAKGQGTEYDDSTRTSSPLTTWHGVEVMIESLPSTLVIGSRTTLECTVRSDVRPHIQWLKGIESSHRGISLDGPSSSMSSHSTFSGFLDPSWKRRLSRHHVLKLQGELFRIVDTKEEVLEHRGDGSYLSKLTIENVSPSDGGKYICLGSNSQSYSFRSAFLSVERTFPRVEPFEESEVHVSSAPFIRSAASSSSLSRSHLHLSQHVQLRDSDSSASSSSSSSSSASLASPASSMALHHHHHGRQRPRDLSSHSNLLVAIVLVIAIASFFLLMVSLYKRRSEPHIPDLSDAPSDELSDQFPASNLTAEFYAPNYHHLLGTSSSPPSSSSSNILSPSSSSSATNNPGWFSINDDSYKNYCSIRDHYATVGDRLTSGFSRELHRPLGCPVDLYPRPQPCCCVTHHNSNQMSQLHFAE